MLNSPLHYKCCLILFTVIGVHTLVTPLAAADSDTDPEFAPIVRVVDLNVGESASVTLSNGEQVQVKLLDLEETRDPIRQAVRSAIVTVEVDGEI
ncbi:MAG TPA: hypothetical protein DCY03_22425, partial [Planctomycetaceae bacterium]|nr:hypothetical protein [Planctomycetaceae bacterium]